MKHDILRFCVIGEKGVSICQGLAVSECAEVCWKTNFSLPHSEQSK